MLIKQNSEIPIRQRLIKTETNLGVELAADLDRPVAVVFDQHCNHLVQDQEVAAAADYRKDRSGTLVETRPWTHCYYYCPHFREHLAEVPLFLYFRCCYSFVHLEMSLVNWKSQVMERAQQIGRAHV